MLARASEGDLTKIKQGLPVEFTVSGAGDAEPVFHGQVEEIRLTPINDRGAVFYKVLIDVQNEVNPATKEWRLRPGQTATVDILRRVHESVWKMPSAALNFQPEGEVSRVPGAKLAAGVAGAA